MNLAKAFMMGAAVLSIAACNGGQLAPTVNPVSTPQIRQAPDYFNIGEYCSSLPERLGQVSGIEGRLNSSGQGQPLKQLSKDIVLIMDKQNSAFSHGIRVSANYVLVAGHAILYKTQVTIPGDKNTYSRAEYHAIWVGYRDELSKSVAEKKLRLEDKIEFGLITAPHATVSSKQDLGLVYAPSASDAVPVVFRSSETLKVGEPVYAYVFLPGGTDVQTVSGTITSLSTVSDYAGQFRVSMLLPKGTSGGPVFDQDGRLIGLLSNYYLPPGKVDLPENYAGTNVSGIDVLAGMLLQERATIAACK